MSNTLNVKEISVPEFEEACAAAARTFGRNHGVRVQFEGDQAYTDGESVINFPALDQSKKLSAEEVMIARGYQDHESGHLVHSDTAFMRAENEAAQKRGDKLYPMALNAVEDVRIEAKIIADYPGALKNLNATTDATCQAFLSDYYEKDKTVVDDIKKILPVAVTWAGRKRLGYPSNAMDKCLAALPEKTRKMAESIASLVDHCKSTQDAASVAKRMVWEVNEAEKEPDPIKGPAGGKGTVKEYSVSAEGGESERTMEAKGGGPGADTAANIDPASFDPSVTAVEPVDVSFNPAALLKSAVGGPEKGYRPYSRSYDRFHFRTDPKNKYVCPADKRNDTWGPHLDDPTGEAKYRNTLERAGGRVNVMRRKMERGLQAKVSRGWIAGQETGRLDPRRLVQAYRGDRTVYKAKEPVPELDTAVSLVVDLSGSMCGSPIKLAQQATICLAETLEKVQVPFEVVGFCAKARPTPKEVRDKMERESAVYHYTRTEAIDMIFFKPFEEQLRVARRSIGHIAAAVGGNNIDGESVLYAWSRLAKRREQRKIMIVLSDGYPACHTHFSESLQRHLREVVGYIADQPNTEIVGIGIQSDAVRRFYPKHQVLNDLDDLPKSIMDNVARMLLGERFVIDNADLIKTDKLRNKNAAKL